jgi:hypothetical protein
MVSVETAAYQYLVAQPDGVVWEVKARAEDTQWRLFHRMFDPYESEKQERLLRGMGNAIAVAITARELLTDRRISRFRTGVVDKFKQMFRRAA